MKIPLVPDALRTIVTPEQFVALYLAIKDSDSRPVVETDIESGLRWGELAELRVKDLDAATRMLTVSRKVVELTTKTHPEGKRFLVTPTPTARSPGGSNSAPRLSRSSRPTSRPTT